MAEKEFVLVAFLITFSHCEGLKKNMFLYAVNLPLNDDKQTKEPLTAFM